MLTESVDVFSTTTIMPVTATTPDSKNGSATAISESSTSASVNLLALEESFGGGTTQVPDPVLPTKRKSGLYFLVDWNTFLEVGDEDSEKINLRFEPKVGDRTRFLPVNIP